MRPPGKILLVVSFAFFVGLSPASATSYTTPDGIFASVAAKAATRFSEQNDGRAPTSWADIETYKQAPIDETFSYLLPSRRYAFIEENLRLPESSRHQGTLLLIARRPFRNSKHYSPWYGGFGLGLTEPGRYIVYCTKSGEYRSKFLLEDSVQKIFATAPHLMPEPDSEPERAYITKHRRKQLTKWIVMTVGLLGTLYLIWRTRRR